MASDDPRIPQDPTPIVGAATDIAPLGGPKPPHERAADEEAGVIDWERLAASERFRNVLKAKRCFVVPAMIFFIVYYFALPVLIGYARPFMERRVLGPVNLAYLFALSQFFMAWITGWQNGVAVAGDYMSAASFVGWLVAYLTVLLVVAEPLRNAGKYTMADVPAYRLNPRPVREMAAVILSPGRAAPQFCRTIR
jgi:uncharacterized membrane protein (DUF485 family)